MTEAGFPLLGATFVLLCILPLATLAAKGGLVLLERHRLGGALHALNLRYMLLTVPTALPLAWFVSAGLHQAETGRSALACVISHDRKAICVEPGFFALMLASAVTVACIWSLRPSARIRPASSAEATHLAARIEKLIGTHPALAALRGRVVTTEKAGFALATHGLLRRRVFVGVTFARNLDNESLVSALGHETEHVRAFDPLRYLLLDLAVAMNPFGRFLVAPHAKRWRAAREAHCDREAVIHGASALALAQAILRAAKAPKSAVALGTRDARIVKFRVGLLLAFAENPPRRCCNEGRSALPLALMLCCIAIVLPHRLGTEPLDVLHSGSEHALSLFIP